MIRRLIRTIPIEERHIRGEVERKISLSLSFSLSLYLSIYVGQDHFLLPSFTKLAIQCRNIRCQKQPSSIFVAFSFFSPKGRLPSCFVLHYNALTHCFFFSLPSPSSTPQKFNAILSYLQTNHTTYIVQYVGT